MSFAERPLCRSVIAGNGVISVVAAMTLLFVGCQIVGCQSRTTLPVFEAPAVMTGVVPERLPDGLSGLTHGRDGQLWAISEHGKLARIADGDACCSTGHVVGADKRIEFESLAFLADGTLVIGTEADSTRSSDLVLFARRTATGTDFEIFDSVSLDYGIWDLRPRPDEGIEGICVTSQHLWVVAETASTLGGRRRGLLGRYDLVAQEWTAFYIEMTSQAGKLSALDCRKTARGFEFIAIERHFGVARLLRGVFPVVPGTSVQPTVVGDWPGMADNPEGVAWSAAGSVRIVTDNSFMGEKSGSSRVFEIPSVPFAD